MQQVKDLAQENARLKAQLAELQKVCMNFFCLCLASCVCPVCSDGLTAVRRGEAAAHSARDGLQALPPGLTPSECLALVRTSQFRNLLVQYQHFEKMK
jgi:hypothetical protein